MHHTKNFAQYSSQKKIQLIVFLVVKLAFVLGFIFALKSLLENFSSSPFIVFGIPHLVLIAIVLAFVFMHKRNTHDEHNHNAECNCK